MDAFHAFGGDFFAVVDVDEGLDFDEHGLDAGDEDVLAKTGGHLDDAAVEIPQQFGLVEEFGAVVFEVLIDDRGEDLGAADPSAEADELGGILVVELIHRAFDIVEGSIEFFSRAMRLLRDGGLVAVLVDQHAGTSGIWTPLFGALASTSPLAASMALRTGAAIVPMAVFTDGFARWRILANEPIPYDGTRPEQLTADINRALEKQIRLSPADWFWVHNRWKIPHPNFLLAREKRGIHLPPDTDPMSLKPFRILIRSSNWLGDAVMSAAAVRAIKNGRPDARVTILTRDKLADFWRAVPEVDDVIPIDDKIGVFRVAWLLRGRFDVAVLFPNSARSALEVWLAGIRRRVGYSGHQREWMLNQIIREPKKKSLRPRRHVERHLRIAEKIGAPETTAEPLIRPIPDGPIRIGICPGAEYGPAKQWYPIRYRRVMESVAARIDGAFVIVGVGKDRPLADEIESGFTGRVENLAGRTSLRELIEELRRMHVLVTNDTGTMHLAAFLGVPVVAIFGSTEPALTGPIGTNHIVIRHQVECSPCFLRECPLDFRCMESVTVDEVANAVLSLLNHPKTGNTALPSSAER